MGSEIHAYIEFDTMGDYVLIGEEEELNTLFGTAYPERWGDDHRMPFGFYFSMLEDGTGFTGKVSFYDATGTRLVE